MSSNPFAALDDSGDEAPEPARTKTVIKEPKKKVTEASAPGSRRQPNNHDRNTKYGRGGRPPAREGKRAYDRHSGTGRGKEIKKGGGGARNWGSDKNDAKKLEGRINEEGDVPVESSTREGDEENNPADSPKENVPSKEDNTMTYSEYITSKGEKKEVTGRESENEFQGFNVSEKKDEESFMVMGGGKQKKNKKKKDTEKKTIEVGFRVANSNTESSRGGGRRDRDESRGDGGRGRGRGRGGRGSNKGPNSSSYSNKEKPGINVQDDNAFPSL